jgi:hypothetical protein
VNDVCSTLSRYLLRRRVTRWPCHSSQIIGRWLVTAQARFRVWVSPCGICGGQSSVRASFLFDFYGFPLPMLFNRCSIFTHVSSGGGGVVARGLLAAQFHGDIVLPHRKNHTDLTKNEGTSDGFELRSSIPAPANFLTQRP